MSTTQILEKGVEWVIGDGKFVTIWHDWWCGDKPLALLHLSERTRSTQKVEALIVNGNLALDEMAQYVDENTLQAINAINLPTSILGMRTTLYGWDLKM